MPVILSLMYVFLAAGASAGELPASCEAQYRALAQPDQPPLRKLIAAQKYQEAIWYLQDKGLAKQARELEAQMVRHLERAPIVKAEFDEEMEISGQVLLEGRVPAQAKVLADESAREVATYRLDRLLGVNLTPITVYRRIRRKMASLQLWVQGIRHAPESTKADPRLHFLDYVTAQTDRGGSNSVRLGKRRVAIDNAMSFHDLESNAIRVRSEFLETYGDWPAEDFVLPGDLISQALKVTNHQILSTLKGTISQREIKAAIARKDFILGIQTKLKANPGLKISEALSK